MEKNKDKIKKLKLDQDISNKIHLFFNGDIEKITKDKLKSIYNDPKINKTEYKLKEEDIKKIKTNY